MFSDGRNRPAQPGCAHESRRVQQAQDAGRNEMTISAIDESQRKTGRVAGLAYLSPFATVVHVKFGIRDRLLVANRFVNQSDSAAR
jgi:hypothetical protein